MEHEMANFGDLVSAAVIRGVAPQEEGMILAGKFDAQCFAPDGSLRWEDEAPNLVTTQGRNDLFDKYLAGSSYTAAFFMGIMTATSWTAPVAGDTMASHANWNESTNYAAANNPAVTWNAAASGNKASNGAVSFAINNNFTVPGPILKTTDIKAG